MTTQTTKDYSEATKQERFDALQLLLSRYHIEFHLDRREEFKPFSKNSKTTTIRYHYRVEVQGYDNKGLFSFPFFTPVQVDVYSLRPTSKQLEVHKVDRFVSFFYCLASDYDFLESEGIRDALDYLKYSGTDDTDAARTQYAALREQETKLNKCFGPVLMRQIQAITEGY